MNVSRERFVSTASRRRHIMRRTGVSLCGHHNELPSPQLALPGCAPLPNCGACLRVLARKVIAPRAGVCGETRFIPEDGSMLVCSKKRDEDHGALCHDAKEGLQFISDKLSAEIDAASSGTRPASPRKRGRRPGGLG